MKTYQVILADEISYFVDGAGIDLSDFCSRKLGSMLDSRRQNLDRDRQIKERYACGVTQVEIAHEFGLSQVRVSQILRGLIQ